MRVEPTFCLYIPARNSSSYRDKGTQNFNNSLYLSLCYSVPLLYLLVLVTACGLFRPTFVDILKISFLYNYAQRKHNYEHRTCYVLMTNEMHNSYNQFLFHSFCLLYMFRTNLVVHHQEHGIIYCITQYSWYNRYQTV